MTTPPTLINGILPYSVETSNTNFLTVTGANHLGAYGNINGTNVTTFDGNLTSNVKITGNQSAFGGPIAENSLIYSAAGTQGFGGNTLTLTSGGLILGNATAVLGSSANDGSITTAAANSELFVDTAANGTINAAITDAVGPTSVALTKFGASTLTLAGTNTFTGPTTIEQGTLVVASTGTIAASSGVTVNAGTTLSNGGTTAAVNNSGTFTNSGTAGNVVLNTGSTNTINGGSTTGTVTLAGTAALTFGATTNTAFTLGNVSATGTPTITYSNTLAAGNTVNFASGTQALSNLTNSAAGGKLTLTGSGATLNIANTFMGNNVTATTVFQSGTYNFSSGPANGGTNQPGLLTVNGATVNFTGGGRFYDSAGGMTTVSAGTLAFGSGFDPGEQQTGGTTITINVNGGILDITGAGTNTGIGKGGTDQTSVTTDILNIAGGTFQNGITSGSGNGFPIGTTHNDYVSSINLSSGLLLSSGAISAAGAPGTGGSNTFKWTGGTLTVPTYTAANLTGTDGTTSTTGTLINGGGTLAPGFKPTSTQGTYTAGTQYTGRTAITGGYSVTSNKAALAINIGGTTSAGGFAVTAADYDNVTVSGATALGGRLSLGLINSYTPPANTTQLYNIVTGSTALSGTFTNLVTGNSTAVAGGTSRVVLANGLSSMLVGINTTASSATTDGLAAVGAHTVAVGGYQATNTYNAASGNAWDAASAADWTYFDPGATSSPSTLASGAIAQFADGGSTGGSGSNTVTLNSTRNIQGIQFSSAVSGHNYTINDAGNSLSSIILDNTGNSAAVTIADSSASGNSNAINVPITLKSNLNASVANAANGLTIGAAVGESTVGSTLTKTGNGTLILTAANSYTGGSTVTGGTLSGTGSSPFGTGTVNVNSGGAIAVNDGGSTGESATTGGQTWAGGGGYTARVANASVSDTMSLTLGTTPTLTLTSTTGSPFTVAASAPTGSLDPTQDNIWQIASFSALAGNVSAPAPATPRFWPPPERVHRRPALFWLCPPVNSRAARTAPAALRCWSWRKSVARRSASTWCIMPPPNQALRCWCSEGCCRC